MARLSLIVLFAQEVLEELVRVDTNTEDRWEGVISNQTTQLLSQLLKKIFNSSFQFNGVNLEVT